MSHVYILRNGDEHCFKIGLTRNPVDSRRRALSTGNPTRLTVFDTIETDHHRACEKFLHRVLLTRRVGGDAREFFALTPDEVRRIVQEARDYVALYAAVEPEAERLSSERSNGEWKSPGNEEISIYQEVLQLREQEARAALRRELLEAKLKVAIGVADGLQGIAAWKSEERQLFDSAAFKETHPDLYEAFRRPTVMRRFCLE